MISQFPELQFGDWTHWEIIEYMTDLYVSKLTPINHDAIQFEKLPNDKNVVIEQITSDL